MLTSEKLDLPVPAEIEEERVRSFAWVRRPLFVALMVISGFAFLKPIGRLFALCLSSQLYSYILLIPLVIVVLFYLERQKIFAHVRWSSGGGVAVMAAGLVGVAAAVILGARLSAPSWLALEVTAMVTLWIGAFVLCFGAPASRSGLFQLLFSFLLVPLPPVMMTEPIDLVRRGSAAVASFFFLMGGVPAVRSGMVFSMPHLIFWVAPECSGIHSTIALFIASILMGHFWIRKNWKKVAMVLAVTPIVALTNGLRIFVIAMLSNYVNIAFFYGNLHHKGGTLFFILALAILAGITKALGGNFELRRRAKAARCSDALIHATK